MEKACNAVSGSGSNARRQDDRKQISTFVTLSVILSFTSAGKACGLTNLIAKHGLIACPKKKLLIHANKKKRDR
jgi:hypothetical protein